MNHSRPIQPQNPSDYNMYDDEPYGEDAYSASQGYQQHSRKDHSRTPPSRGAPAGNDRTQGMAYSEHEHYQTEDRGGYGRESGCSWSPRRENRGRYTDRDREGYRSPPRERSRSRSPYYGGPPNRNVILEGLPIEMTQEDILNELQHSLRLEGLEEVRLIKDKKTGQSRQFAFAQFGSIPDARRFLDAHYPNVSLYGSYDPSQSAESQPAKVRIAYSRERGDDRDRAGKSEDDWKCDSCSLPNFAHRTLCFRCNVPRTRASAHGVLIAQANMSSFSGFATTGDSDASPDGIASQFLLLRGLEPGVNEELLAKGVCKLYKTKAATPPKDMHTAKKTKIASTSTSNDSSLGAKERSLRRVLLVRDRKTNDSWRYGFAEFNTVEDAQAAMAKYKASEKFTISSKPVLVSYIHAGVFVPVIHLLDDELSQFTFSPLSNSGVKLMYWDEAAYVNELVTAVPELPSAAKIKGNENAKRAAAAANEGLLKDGELRPKKRKIEKEPKVVVAPHLQFWSNRHAEIHGIPPKGPDDGVSELPKPKPQAKTAEAPSTAPAQSFADMARKCCLLCSRQFKTDEEVKKHERISQLHRDNTKKEDLVAKALLKLNKSIESADNSAYRDRAKERRQAFNQPKQPAAQHNRQGKVSGAGSSPKNDEEAPETLKPSKGAALLGKMGWSAGEGLGAQGTGITNAITTEVYSAGVGLGAQGGKLGDAVEEAQRQTVGSYADFLSKTKDKAKERYDRLE